MFLFSHAQFLLLAFNGSDAYVFVQAIHLLYPLLFMALWIVRHLTSSASSSVPNWLYMNKHALRLKVCSILSIWSIFVSDNLDGRPFRCDKPVLFWRRFVSSFNIA